ncbi:MAG: Peptidase Xaa-His dipeptidase [Thermoleophilia bacterium]|nr:Peptidase Xaa-His dipeptidase [Thermoleophilia bacterium]
MSEKSALVGLEPALVWERFAELTQIARPSKEEEAAREHVLAWAAARELVTNVDDEGNIVVQIPASAGRESAPIVVLQSHLDMVCERDPGSPYDPREGRINVAVDGDWVLAEGTTLGADNGIGVAAAMAAADDPGIEHGPLELLFTVSEEQGLDGAKALDPSLVSGRLLLNLDGTSDAAVTVGCAGSAHTFVRVQLELEPPRPNHVALEVVLSGAKGGHSGGDIASGRVNAIKALGRILGRSYEQEPFRLARFDGGASRNAIPREARAAVSLEPDAEPAFRAAAEQELAALREQYAGFDDALVLSVERIAEMEATDEPATARVLDLAATIPTGVIAMSPALSGTVETSTSLTVATTGEGTLTLASMTRSSNARALEDVVATIAAAARFAGASIEVVRSYPPWRPDLESRLLTVSRATFERLFGVEPALAVVHGGLECAVIGAKLPGVEMISIGPEIVGPHAPGERLSISGTQRFYRLLGALLDDLSRQTDIR